MKKNMAKHIEKSTVLKPNYLGGGSWELRELNDITVIFGRNGAGKSQLLRNLRNTNKQMYHYIAPERTGEISHDLGIMQEELSAEKRANRRQQNLAATYRQEAISRIQSLLLKIGSLTGRAGVVSPVALGDLEKLLRSLLPDFDFSITDQTPFFSMKRISNDEGVSSASALSSGETEILTLSLDLLTVCAMWGLENQVEKILLIDEPDTHLHPDLQQHLADFLVRVANQYSVQMIIATHSTTLLSALGYHGKERVSIIYLNNTIAEQRALRFESSLQELSTCLGGHALMGPLFSAPLLLVEGDDEDKIWSHVPRYNVVNISVLPCDGSDEVKKYQKTLEKLFACLRTNSSEPIGFALLDGDVGLPQPDANNPQANIRFIQLSCRESENLFLTDEVLVSLGISNWEEAKIKIKAESQEYGSKEQKLQDCDQWDRKNSDIKDVIFELTQILSPKNIPWTKRVAKCIGSQIPNGQLAEFLGDDVIEAIWR